MLVRVFFRHVLTSCAHLQVIIGRRLFTIDGGMLGSIEMTLGPCPQSSVVDRAKADMSSYMRDLEVPRPKKPWPASLRRAVLAAICSSSADPASVREHAWLTAIVVCLHRD